MHAFSLTLKEFPFWGCIQKGGGAGDMAAEQTGSLQQTVTNQTRSELNRAGFH